MRGSAVAKEVTQDEPNRGKMTEKTADRTNPKPYLVCAFYTPDYAPIVAGLADGLDRLGLAYHIEEVPPAGGWEANTRLKPQFIANCLSRFAGQDILFLDADARLRKDPVLFDNVSTDIAIRLFRVTKRGRTWLRPSANTIYFRNNVASRKLVDSWVRRSAEAQAYEVDEDTLCRALDEAEHISITALPQSYSKVFDAAGADPVIEQLQVSRNKPRLLRRQRQVKQFIAAGILLAIIGMVWTVT